MLRTLAHDQTSEIATMQDLGKIANQAASLAAFEDYKSRKADQTLRQHAAALALFADYLETKGALTVGVLFNDPLAWEGITWGLVAAFQKWLLLEGYAINTVDSRISTIKTYAKLATKAGALAVGEYALIKAVEGYGRKAGARVDQRREITRKGYKKALAVGISTEGAKVLKEQLTDTETNQAKRDRVIMCFLLDHGLRVGELAGLTVDTLDLQAGTFTFYRSKVDKTQTQALTADTLDALTEYITQAKIIKGSLLRGSVRGGGLTIGGMSTRAINKRVGVLGAVAGIAGLSPHDCRHYAVTKDARKGKDVYWLMEKYGWSSPAMPIRYIEASKVIETE